MASSVIRTIQPVAIALASTSTFASATLASSVTSASAMVVWNGWNSAGNSAISIPESFGYFSLASPTQVNFTRSLTGVAITGYATVIEWLSGVNSIQAGTIAIPSAAASASASLAIPVGTGAFVIWNGFAPAIATSTSFASAQAGFVLTSGTPSSIAIYSNTSGNPLTGAYTVVDLQATIVSAVQPVSANWNSGQSQPIPINAVAASATMIVWGGNTTNASTLPPWSWYLTQTSSTNVSAVNSRGGAEANSMYLTLVTFQPSVLSANGVQSGILPLSSSPSATAGINTVNPSYAFANFLGVDFSSSVSAPNSGFVGVQLSGGTTLTEFAFGSTTVSGSWQVVEFASGGSGGTSISIQELASLEWNALLVSYEGAWGELGVALGQAEIAGEESTAALGRASKTGGEFTMALGRTDKAGGELTLGLSQPALFGEEFLASLARQDSVWSDWTSLAQIVSSQDAAGVEWKGTLGRAEIAAVEWKASLATAQDTAGMDWGLALDKTDLLGIEWASSLPRTTKAGGEWLVPLRRVDSLPGEFLSATPAQDSLGAEWLSNTLLISSQDAAGGEWGLGLGSPTHLLIEWLASTSSIPPPNRRFLIIPTARGFTILPTTRGFVVATTNRR